MNFKFFVEATIYEPIIMLMPLRDDVIKVRKYIYTVKQVIYVVGK